jgi:hypothetical protein
MQKEVRLITNWLKREDNSLAKLAHELGYNSSAAVEKWMQRDKVPNHMKKRIAEVTK